MLLKNRRFIQKLDACFLTGAGGHSKVTIKIIRAFQPSNYDADAPKLQMEKMMIRPNKSLSIITGVIALVAALAGFVVINAHADSSVHKVHGAGGLYSTNLGF
jgi:hypothetical protein